MSHCIFCRRPVLIVLLGGVTAAVLWQHFLSSPYHLLQVDKIKRVGENSLSDETFVEEFLSKGQPVIIVRETTGSKKDWSSIRPSLLNNCGGQNYSAIPIAMQWVLHGLKPVEQKYFGWFLRLTAGVDFDNWVKERKVVTLEGIDRISASPISLKNEMPLLSRVFLPFIAQRVLTFFLLPHYLGDLVLSHYEAQQCGIPLTETLQEANVLAGLRSKGFAEPIGQQMSWTFWGGIDSSNYPLHRDNNDNDVFIDVFEGCKEVVVVHPDERHKLNPLPIENANVWQNDFFLGRPRNIEKVWRGRINAGETLFLPGDSLHEARNQCASTVSNSRRPWPSYLVRAVEFRMAESKLIKPPPPIFLQ